MAKFHGIKTSFTGGEITPRLRGRVNVDKVVEGLETLTNFIVSPYGGVYRRTGLKFVNELADETVESRLIPFEGSDGNSFAIEMNNANARFYTNQGILLQSRDFTNGDFASNITGWTDISAGTGSISHDAGNARMDLNSTGGGNEARAEQIITYLGTAQYTVTLDVGTNSVTYKVGTTSGATDIATGVLTAGVGKTFNFTPSTNYADIYFTFESSATAYIDNVDLDSPTYKIATPYATADLPDLRFAQSSDVMYIVHKDYAPRKLTKFASSAWFIEEVAFDEPPFMEENTTTTTLTPSAVTGSITVTASADTFVSTDVGRSIRYKSGEDTSEAIIYDGTATQTNFDIPFYPQAAADLEVILVDSTGARTTQTLTTHYTVSGGQIVMVSAPGTTDKLIVQPVNAGSGKWGWATITAYSTAVSVTALVKEELQGTNASLQWRIGSWSDTTGYPRAVSFHEQRLWFGGSVSEPQAVWASATGSFEDFAEDGSLLDGTILEDGGLSFTIASTKAEVIYWLSSQTSLLVGTSNAVHSFTGGSGSISALNVSRRKEQSLGCEQALQLETDNETVFVQRLKQKLNSLGYLFDIQGFQSKELSIFAEHIPSESGLVSMTYQKNPSSTIWATREDGSLISCTYDQQQGISGWSKHVVGGTSIEVEAITSIPGTSYNEVWVIVKRTINSATHRYVEFLTSEFNQNDKEDAFFVDSGLTYSGSPATSVTGLSHLEGETVAILADGATHPDGTVASGSVTLNASYSDVHVGLGYTSELLTNNFEGGSQVGTSQITIARIFEAGIRFHETIGANVGYSSSDADIVQFRNASDDMDTSPSLFTGDKIIKFPRGQENNYKIYVSQAQPLPMTVLGLVYKAEISDR